MAGCTPTIQSTITTDAHQIGVTRKLRLDRAKSKNLGSSSSMNLYCNSLKLPVVVTVEDWQTVSDRPG
jgi:hypothetical protein